MAGSTWRARKRAELVSISQPAVLRRSLVVKGRWASASTQGDSLVDQRNEGAVHQLVGELWVAQLMPHRFQGVEPIVGEVGHRSLLFG